MLLECAGLEQPQAVWTSCLNSPCFCTSSPGLPCPPGAWAWQHQTTRTPEYEAL